MGLAAWLFGSGGDAIAKPVEAVGNALDKLVTSDEERAAADLLLEKLRQQPHILQAEITKVEAAHPSVFVAGWRPAIGWVCVLSLAAYYPPRFIIATVLWTMHIVQTGQWMAPPEVGISDILGLVGTLLGIAGLRTIEKKAEVAR